MTDEIDGLDRVDARLDVVLDAIPRLSRRVRRVVSESYASVDELSAARDIDLIALRGVGHSLAERLLSAARAAAATDQAWDLAREDAAVVAAGAPEEIGSGASR